MMNARGHIKSGAGWMMARANGQCRYDRMIVVMSHMRAASTALTNILGSHPDISGYGEAHVPYHSATAPGVLAIHQLRRKAWSPKARFLADKILHNALDDAVPDSFYNARAVFLLRRPEATIPSITRLFKHIGSVQFTNETDAAQYYLARILRLRQLWDRFPADQRIGLLSEDIWRDPDQAIGDVQSMLRLSPPLTNTYRSHKASTGHGSGDPLQSAAHSQIQAREVPTDLPDPQIDAGLLMACRAAYADLSVALRT